MKFKRLLICSLVILFVMIAFSEAFSLSYGRIRALKERAVTVTQQKNHFVMRVLESYTIAYKCNLEGVVVRLKVDDQWNDIARIDIIPLMNDDGRGFRVMAHNIFFDTNKGIFHLVSELIIR